MSSPNITSSAAELRSAPAGGSAPLGTPPSATRKLGRSVMSDRLREILIALVTAVGASIFLNFVLLAIAVFAQNGSSLTTRVADAMMAPAGALTERFLPGHSGAQLFFGFVISCVLYTLVIWPVIALPRLGRRR